MKKVLCPREALIDFVSLMKDGEREILNLQEMQMGIYHLSILKKN